MVIYDSGWVPNSIGVAPSSGSIAAAVSLDRLNRARIIYAASGSNGVNNAASAPALSWSAGAGSPTPYLANRYRSTPAYPVAPLITGSYAVTGSVLATSSVIYTLGSSMSGANHLDDWVPDTIYVGLTPGSGSYARVIVEGR